MLYVIQTKSKDEHQVDAYIEQYMDKSLYSNRFIPLYEEVRRRRKENRIILRRLFPGYIFIDTDSPKDVYLSLRKMKDFARILGTEEKGGEKYFIPVRDEEREFLFSILDDGIMHVSYIEKQAGGSRGITKVVGPLARYRNHIKKIDISHREAVVEAYMFGRDRKIRFGLWLDDDPRLPWLEAKRGIDEEAALDDISDIDVGIYPGDKVIDTTGVYRDYEFTVESIDMHRRTISAYTNMLGGKWRMEFYLYDVKRV